MGEIIKTQFSPDQLVNWERKNGSEFKKGTTDLISQHKISSIRIDIFNSYKWKTVEGKLESFKGGWYSFLSWITFKDHRKASDYGKKAITETWTKRLSKQVKQVSEFKDFQNYNIKPYVSNLVLEELSALDNELDDAKKLKQMTKLLLKVLNDIGAVPVKNIKVTNEVKEFYEFLLNIGITKNDAAHFTITVFHGIDAFLSFNKKIFVKKKNKIDRKLMILRKKPPVILEVDELYLGLKKLDKYNFI